MVSTPTSITTQVTHDLVTATIFFDGRDAGPGWEIVWRHLCPGSNIVEVERDAVSAETKRISVVGALSQIAGAPNADFGCPARRR
jgi:hypothetical protein